MDPTIPVRQGSIPDWVHRVMALFLLLALCAAVVAATLVWHSP